ncbi:MAG TPA: amidohydrolase family protein [Bryobacteraceae bacterium]|nr:amidohydrolase family protein [Bryobacteraceae bacterium]
MKAYAAQIRMNLRLMFRDRSVIFFNYLFPLIFFFMFGQMMHAQQGGALQVVNMVLIIGILGTGFFGAGIRAVLDREQNILRRFKVAPINAGPILVASLVSGLVNYLPLVILIVALAHILYAMPYPAQPVSFLVFVSLGVVAFRALGGIIAAVVNSMQESQILIQILYFPMLLLSGATIPLAIMPVWLQSVAQFIPSTYLSTGLEGILLGQETIFDNLSSVAALVTTAIVGTFLGVKLFRWEKEEKMRGSAKLWVLAVLAPFVLMGTWQAHAKSNLAKVQMQAHDLERRRSWLIKDARLFLGDGTVVERGAVLVRNGKIESIFTGDAPDAKVLKAEAIEASGKTLMPGLIDVHVHLGATGGIYASGKDYQPVEKSMPRELAAYLYSGVTAVKSAGDSTSDVLRLRGEIASGEKLGAELFVVGPLFTTEGGHGTEYAASLPAQMRPAFNAEFLRMPKTAEDAQQQVAELKKRGVDGIKIILEAGAGSRRFERMEVAMVRAVAEAARANGLPVVCHTGDARDVADALDAGVNGIEHGSFRDAIPEKLFARMKQMGVTYDPTLTVGEAFEDLARGHADPLERSLVEQVGPPALIQSTKRILISEQGSAIRQGFANFPMSLEQGKQNLLAAWRAGVALVAGTDSGNPLLIHGPAIHRELQLWVSAGVPAAVALEAATHGAAKLLRADQRIGLMETGYEASLLLADGNPLQDIGSTEHVSMVLFKGQRVDRTELVDQQ